MNNGAHQLRMMDGIFWHFKAFFPIFMPCLSLFSSPRGISARSSWNWSQTMFQFLDPCSPPQIFETVRLRAPITILRPLHSLLDIWNIQSSINSYLVLAIPSWFFIRSRRSTSAKVHPLNEWHLWTHQCCEWFLPVDQVTYNGQVTRKKHKKNATPLGHLF